MRCEFAALGEITEDHFDKIFAINVKGTLFTVQKALPILRDSGSIILTGIPALSVYSASKAAIRNFARGWILDLARRKTRVNVLAPGATSTPGWHVRRGAQAGPYRLDERLHSEDGDHPLQIVGKNVKAHLRADLFESAQAEVGRAHPRLDGSEWMFRGLAPDAHAPRSAV